MKGLDYYKQQKKVDEQKEKDEQFVKMTKSQDADTVIIYEESGLTTSLKKMIRTIAEIILIILLFIIIGIASVFLAKQVNPITASKEEIIQTFSDIPVINQFISKGEDTDNGSIQ